MTCIVNVAFSGTSMTPHDSEWCSMILESLCLNWGAPERWKHVCLCSRAWGRRWYTFFTDQITVKYSILFRIIENHSEWCWVMLNESEVWGMQNMRVTALIFYLFSPSVRFFDLSAVQSGLFVILRLVFDPDSQVTVCSSLLRYLLSVQDNQPKWRNTKDFFRGHSSKSWRD